MKNHREVTWPTAGFLLGGGLVGGLGIWEVTASVGGTGAAIGYIGAIRRLEQPTTEINGVPVAIFAAITLIFMFVIPTAMLLPPETPLLGLVSASFFTWLVSTREIPEFDGPPPPNL